MCDTACVLAVFCSRSYGFHPYEALFWRPLRESQLLDD